MRIIPAEKWTSMLQTREQPFSLAQADYQFDGDNKKSGRLLPLADAHFCEREYSISQFCAVVKLLFIAFYGAIMYDSAISLALNTIFTAQL